MFGDELGDVLSELKTTNLLLREVIRLLHNLEDTMPRCVCQDEHAVGDTWQCVFHGTVTRAE